MMDFIEAIIQGIPCPLEHGLRGGGFSIPMIAVRRQYTTQQRTIDDRFDLIGFDLIGKWKMKSTEEEMFVRRCEVKGFFFPG